MSDALVTGLAGLVSRVTDPLVSRLRDLGLEKPAALLADLPNIPDPAERLDGFVKVHQVVGIALVRLASTTSIVGSDLERLPTAGSIAIRRPSTPLTPEKLLAARLEGTLSRYEAAWHRGKHFESLSLDELLEEWPSIWSDADAAPLVSRLLAEDGRAVAVAREVLADRCAGLTTHLTAIRVLQRVGNHAARDVLREAASAKGTNRLIRARAGAASATERRGWRSFFRSDGSTPDPKAVEQAIDRLTTAKDKDARVSAVEELEQLWDEDSLPALRQAWRFDPAQDVRARAAIALGKLGDGESVEAFVTALRDRAHAPREAKAALTALGELGDVRAVPDILHALIESWAGPLPMETLHSVGIPALEPIIALTADRPELAQRKSLQEVVKYVALSKQAERLLTRGLAAALDGSGQVERAASLLKLTAESVPLRESLARQILAHMTTPSSKGEKALVRAATQALEKTTGKPEAVK
jgi:hypothetical protein